MRYVIKFKNEVDNRVKKSNLISNIETLKFMNNIIFCDIDNSDDVDELINMFDTIKYIESVKENIEDDSSGESNLSDQAIPYYFSDMQIDKFHSEGYTGEGVKVAVMDGGCQPHNDLNIAGGYQAFHDRDTGYMTDLSGHGTHIAGIIGMQDNDIGYIGVAPDVELYIIKRWNDSGTSGGVEAVARGFDWCIQNNIDIVNCSFGNRTNFSQTTYEVYKEASKHLIIVQSAGNAQNETQYNGVSISAMNNQASFPFVVSVGNLGENGFRYPSSAVGNNLDFVAYGRNILSTFIDSSNEVSDVYRTMSGTSMSAPVITGMIALYKQMFPDLENDDLIDLMKRNTKKNESTWEVGSGLPQFPNDSIKMVKTKQKVNDEWLELFPKTNAVNVMTSLGDNLEEVIERLFNTKVSINSNGQYYALFDSGLAICWGECSEVHYPNRPNDSETIFDSPTTFQSYPIAFKSPPFVTVNSGNIGCWATAPASNGLTSFNYKVFSTRALFNTGITVKYFAIGLWK